MPHSSIDEIIEAVRQRISDPRRATDSHLRSPYPPTTRDRVKIAEDALGFALPPLLVRLYTEVANGGFGPGYGIAGVDGCGSDEGRNDIVTLYRAQSDDDWRASLPRWPAKMLRLAYLGCAMSSCIDCAAPDFPVFIFEPNPSEEDFEEAWGFANNLAPYNLSFDEWIRRWAGGEDVELPAIFNEET